MAQVIVRNLSDDVVAALKRNAARRGHSLEQELRDVLTSAARLSAADRLAVSRKIRALVSGRKLLSDSARLIREDRDRR
jgi:plasmid stability protein